MELPKAGRTKLFYTSLEALEHITAPDEDAESVLSSGLDSADTLMMRRRKKTPPAPLRHPVLWREEEEGVSLQQIGAAAVVPVQRHYPVM
ncbi:hypothetical protein ATANTOWER_015773 [Ataeniobius toweri]|uniref:Uncharacterized protein n=1 Tax=Ataeniobius toweri TaxID=208326 RepID=A0ABU7BBT3_9TELE|nr:hypothetical protein [Ataeniobius toweri]